MANILVIDDSESIQAVLANAFRDSGSDDRIDDREDNIGESLRSQGRDVVLIE
jgi:DNA-binding NtrC family response regulator